MRLRLLPFVLLALAVFASLSGCASSPPPRFIALNPIAPAAAPIKLAGSPVRLGKMQFPGELDQPYLVVETGTNTRRISNTIRWIAPPQELIRATLAADLANRLDPASFIQGPGASLDRRARVLLVTIDAFMPDTDGAVKLDARWRLVGDSGSLNRTGPSGHATIEVPAKGSDPGDIAAAMSRALAHLGNRIVAQLKPAAAD